ncbi:MAG: tol-pal system protein YbgF [Acidobacteriota bacterium]
MRIAAAAIAMALAGCASTDADRPASLVPPPETTSVPSSDPRVAELQTSMTELLERLDVLNARMAKLESGTPASSPAGPAASPPPVSVPVPSMTPARPSAPLHAAAIADDYRNALMLFGKSRFPEARAAFQQVFDVEPSGELADNALYWIGESYFAAGDYPNAMKYYERVTKEYGETNKAPDALFKTGLAFEKSGDLAMARRAFDECIRRYPYSTPAASAKLELKRIKY